jgi:hypothetical protein
MRMAEGNVSRKFYQQTNLVACRERHHTGTNTRPEMGDPGPRARVVDAGFIEKDVRQDRKG